MITWLKKYAPFIFGIIALILCFMWGNSRGYRSGLTACLQQDSVVMVYDTQVVVKTRVAELVQSQPAAVPSFIDTAAVIKAFYQAKEYQSSFENSEIRIKANPFVFQNQVDSVRFTYQILRPAEVTYNTLRPPSKNILYAGFTGGRGVAAPGILYQQGNWVGGASYNLTGQPRLQFSIHYKILNW